MKLGWIGWAAPVALALNLAACEGETADCEVVSSNGDPAAFLSVEGFTIQHSLCKKAAEGSEEAIEASDLLVELVDPASLVQGGDGVPFASQPLETSTLGQSPSDWSFTGTDLPETATTLLASISDGRDTDPLWATTYATVADAAALEAVRATDGQVIDARTFALTRDVIDVVIAPLLGLSGEELLARGMVLGIVVDQPSSCGGEQPPVSDCTVSSSRQDLTISYPNSTVSSLTDETANQGMFFAVPDAVGEASVVNFSVTPGGSDDRVWRDDLPVWIVPGAVTVQLFVAG